MIKTPTTSDSAPLEGCRVIDFGHYFAGPLAGMLLADQGAEVVKIDRLGQKQTPQPVDTVFNRGKQRLQLDLKTPDDLENAKQLVKSADVLIENFRPGVMRALGLGPDEMTRLNPRLIYLSLPGFPSADEFKASIRAFEGVVSAATGFFRDLHDIRRELEAPPVYTPLPVPSAYAAVHGALAVTLALYAREQTSLGDVIEVPLSGAAMSAMGAFVNQWSPLNNLRRPNPANQPLRERMKRADPDEQDKLVEELRTLYHPMWDSYATADGGWVYMLAHNNSRHSVNLVKGLGIYNDLIADGMTDLPAYENLGRTDNLQLVERLLPDLKEKLRGRIATAFLKKSASEWIPIMQECGVPFSIHRTTRDWLYAPEALEAALIVVIDEPLHGEVRQLGLQTTLSRTADDQVQPRRSCPAKLSKLLQNRQVWPARKSPSAKPGRGILEGIRVLDLSTVLAGPCCARTLAEYGADVIKIDSPSPYLTMGTVFRLHLEVGQGKRSIILDLKQAAGKEIFLELVKQADVIVQNFRPGVAERLGIDYDLLSKLNPELIYLNLTAFQGPRPGPWTYLTGFDPVLQAATGIMTRYGGNGQRPEIHGFASCIDYLTGYSGAFGIALALLKRQLFGGGTLVLTSLAQGAQLVQAPFMLATASSQSAAEPQGQRAQGEHSLQRIYRANDGWIFLAGLCSDLPKLHELPQLAGVPLGHESEEERLKTLVTAIQEHPVGFWVKAFNDAGLGCHRIDCTDEIRNNCLTELNAEDLKDWSYGDSISVIRVKDHPAGSPVDNHPPTYARFRNTALKIGNPMPKLGSDTRAVLEELGRSKQQINDLLASGVIKDQLHDAYLPF